MTSPIVAKRRIRAGRAPATTNVSAPMTASASDTHFSHGIHDAAFVDSTWKLHAAVTTTAAAMTSRHANESRRAQASRPPTATHAAIAGARATA